MTKNIARIVENRIAPEEIDRLETERKQIAAENAPKDKWTLFLEKCKHHKYLIVRIGYKIFHSISLVFGAIGAFLAWMVAMANA